MGKKHLVIAAILGLIVSACGEDPSRLRGSGRIITEDRPVASFDMVSICCGMGLVLEQGETRSLRLEGDDNILPEISTEVTGGQLQIEYGNDSITSFSPSRPVEVRVVTPNLLGLSLSGGSSADGGQLDGGQLDGGNVDSDVLSVTLSGGSSANLAGVQAAELRLALSGGSRLLLGQVTAEILELFPSGGSDVTIETLEGGTITAIVAGGSEVTLSGRVGQQLVELSGGSQYNAADLITLRSAVQAGGEATVWAVQALDVDLSGGAKVRYYGEPEVFERLSGGSEVERLGNRE